MSRVATLPKIASPVPRGNPLRLVVLTILALLEVLAPSPATAQDPDSATVEDRLLSLEMQVAELRARLDAGADNADLAEVRMQIEAITHELERLRLGEEVASGADTTAFGFGPAASKVYRSASGVSIGGYGEILYQNYKSTREDGAVSGLSDQIDALRAVFYFGYKFNDHFLFNSEIEFEHGSTSTDGEVSVEFAYLDYRFGGTGGSSGLRGGVVLLPMGFINELHEPPTYLGSLRPETELRIIPTTWREVGLGAFGDLGDFSWRTYLVNGMDGVGDVVDGGGFDAGGLRGGRQKASRASANDFAGVARVDWTGLPGLMVGGSAYYGGSGQEAEDPLAPGTTIDAPTFIWEAHFAYRSSGIDLRALYAAAKVEDVPSLNAAKGLEGTRSIGERLAGWYVQAGYDLLWRVRTAVQVLPYVRYERIDTQRRVPAGFGVDPANDRDLITIGAQVLPIPQIVLKADYTFESTAADSGVDRFNVSLGYLF